MRLWLYLLGAACVFNALMAASAKHKAESLLHQVQALEATVHHLARPESHQHPELSVLGHQHQRIQRLEQLLQDNARLKTLLRQQRPPRLFVFHPPSWLWMRRRNADEGP